MAVDKHSTSQTIKLTYKYYGFGQRKNKFVGFVPGFSEVEVKQKAKHWRLALYGKIIKVN